MNLLEEKWIPIIEGNKTEFVTLHEAKKLPFHKICPFRPDWQFAITLFAIGLKKTGFVPAPVFEGVERFMQSYGAREGNERPVGMLLLGEPGVSTRLKNTDHFIKGGERDKVCSKCAAIALYTDSIFTGVKGSGYFPGSHSGAASYLIIRDTFGETVDANIIDDEIDPHVYFHNPNLIWLNEPSEQGECKICRNTGPLITSFFMKKSGVKTVPSLSPHSASTPKGIRFNPGGSKSELFLTEGCALDSQIAVQPEVIKQNGKLGDQVVLFNIYYNKAAFKGWHTRFFQIRQGADWELLRITMQKIWLAHYPESKPNYESSLLIESEFMISDRILELGYDVRLACYEVIDEKAPSRCSKGLADLVVWQRSLQKNGDTCQSEDGERK